MNAEVNAEASETSPNAIVVAQLGQPLDGAAVERWLSSHPALLSLSIVRQLAEAVRLEVRIDVDRALRLAEAALAIAIKIGDAEGLGLAYRAKANALWFANELRPAIELFQLAVDSLERAGNVQEVGRTLSSCIQPLILLGEYAQALQAAERARAIFSRAGDFWRLARLDINVANIHHRQDRFTEALERYQSAYDQLQPYKDQEATAAALHNMSVCLIMLDDFDRALETHSRARKLAQESNMPLVAVQADYNIAYLHFLRGDYQVAIDALRVTREKCDQNSGSYHAALCDLDESELYLELNLSDEAAEMADRARKRFEELGITLETGRSILNSAVALHQRREYSGALALFAKAEDIFKRDGNKGWRALVGLYRAMVYSDIGDAERAAPVCREALDFFVTAGLDRRAILCRLLLARIARANRNFEEAQQHCQTALQTLAGIEAPILSYYAHIIVGDLQRTLGRPRESYGSYRCARRHLEGLRASLQGEELKISFMKNRGEVYEKLIDLCLETRNTRAHRVFRYMERAKSRNLAESVLSRRSPLSWPARSAAGERIGSLRKELNWYYRRLEVEQTRPEGISLAQISHLQAEARSREDEIVRIVRQSADATSTADGVELGGPVSMEEIHESLGGETSLIEYFQVQSRLLAAVVARGQVEILELGDVGRIGSSVRMLDFQLSSMTVRALRRRDDREARLAAVNHHLHELYRCLVEPLLPKLTKTRLVVVPHGVLHYVPFHALYDGQEHLVDRFVISYAPSASIHAICRRKSVNRTGPSLLLGVSDKRTPWIRQEIRSVAEVLPEPQIRTGRHATADVLKNVGPGSRFIHIATHGVFRRDNPMFSNVRLADSYVNIYDLYQLALRPELLTLSGCGTGLSVVAGGDELLGLIRGLMSAGAASLLLTLWDVHDSTTAEFMACFYRRLHIHGDKGLALREAMLDVRQSHPHPYYWAPFVLVGNSFATR